MTDATVANPNPMGSVPVQAEDSVGQAQSLTAEAWKELRSNYLFWASLVLIVTFLVMAAFPRVFTSTSPTAFVASAFAPAAGVPPPVPAAGAPPAPAPSRTSRASRWLRTRP